MGPGVKGENPQNIVVIDLLTTIQLHHYASIQSIKTSRQYEKEWAWLYSNKALFTKIDTDRGLPLWSSD